MVEYNEMLNRYNKTGSIKLNSNISFIDYINEFIDEYVKNNCRETTMKTYVDRIDNGIRSYFSNYKLRDITPTMIYEHLVDLYKQGYSKNYVYSVKTLLYSMFSFAVFPKEYLDKNPVESVNISRLKFAPRSIPELDEDKLRDIIVFMNQYGMRRFYIIPLKIIYYTGLRKSELLALQWSDINWSERYINVNKQIIYDKHGNATITPPKTKAGIRKIYYDDSLYDILNEQLSLYNELGMTHNYICFKSDCTPITRGNMDVIAQTINRRVCRFSWHAVRHLHATKLVESGAAIKSIAYRMGHESIKTTLDTYTSMTDKLTKDVLNRIDEL